MDDFIFQEASNGTLPPYSACLDASNSQLSDKRHGLKGHQNHKAHASSLKSRILPNLILKTDRIYLKDILRHSTVLSPANYPYPYPLPPFCDCKYFYALCF